MLYRGYEEELQVREEKREKSETSTDMEIKPILNRHYRKFGAAVGTLVGKNIISATQQRRVHVIVQWSGKRNQIHFLAGNRVR